MTTEPKTVALLDPVAGFGTGVTIPASPARWADGDVVLVQITLPAMRLDSPSTGFILGDVVAGRGWHPLPPEIVLIGSGEHAICRWWARPSDVDFAEPQTFTWPAERPFMVALSGFQGLRRLGDPLSVSPRLLRLLPNQAELDIADAVSVAESPGYAFLAGLDELQRELCDWVEQHLAGFNVEALLAGPDHSQQSQHSADNPGDDGDPASEDQGHGEDVRGPLQRAA